MTQVRLFTADGAIEADRMQLLPQDLQPGDFLVCPYTGFHHVHEVVRRGRLVDIVVCDGIAHVYNHNTLLEVARPVQEGEGGAQ